MREFVLQRLELLTALGAPLDEDVAVEARLDLQREPRRTIEELLRLGLGEIREQQGLR